MKRPTLEVADVIRSAGKSFIERNPIASGLAALEGAACH
jgi:hypothetical protein